MIASLMELLSRPPRSILGKDTSPVFFANYLCNRWKLPLDTVLEILRNSPEFDVVIEPLLREINATYHKFIFRKPTPQEITRHLRQFREELKTSQARFEAVKSGDIRAHLGIRPLNLEMDIVNQCNLRCTMCHFSNDEFAKRRKKEITVEQFASIAEQIFPLCTQMSLSLGNEPLLHRKLDELIDIAMRYGIPHVYMHTNGILLNERIIDHLVQSKFNQLNISIDAATKTTYERIRVRANFDRLIANIQAVNRAKRRHGSDPPPLL